MTADSSAYYREQAGKLFRMAHDASFVDIALAQELVKLAAHFIAVAYDLEHGREPPWEMIEEEPSAKKLGGR